MAVEPEKTTLAQAMVAFQSELEAVKKTSDNPFFKSKYADFATIKNAVQPLLTKHRLAVVQMPTTLDGKPALRTILMNESGERLEDVMLLVLSKEDPQAQGSAITYAKRYAFSAVLGIVTDEDDDGNAASGVYAPRASVVVGATQKQIDLIRKLAASKGFDEDAIDKRIATIKSAAEASEVIAKLLAEKEE